MSRKVRINTKIRGGLGILRSGCLFEVCTPFTSSTSSSASHSSLVLVPPPHTHTVALSRARNSRKYRPCQSHPIACVSSSHHLLLSRTRSSRLRVHVPNIECICKAKWARFVAHRPPSKSCSRPRVLDVIDLPVTPLQVGSGR